MVKSILIGALSFTGTIALQLVSFVVSLYCARLLSLDQFGALNMIKTIFMYASFSTLGITEAVTYKLPVLLAKEDPRGTSSSQKLLFTISLFSNILVLIVLTVLFSNSSLNNVNLTYEWLLIGIIILISSLAYFSEVILTGYQNFLGMAVFKIIYPLIFGTLIYFLLPRLQVMGFLIATCAAYSAMFIYSFYFIKDKIGLILNLKEFWGHFKEHFKLGFPIKIGSFIWVIFTSVDLWVVSLFIDTGQAGLYSFVLLVGSSFFVIPEFLLQFVKPRIAWFFGKVNEQKKQLARPYKMIIIPFLLVGIGASVLALIFFYMLISVYLTKYIPALFLIPILLCGYVLENLTSVTTDILILFKKQVKVLCINSFALVLVIILDLIAAFYFKSMMLVAMSTAVGLTLDGLINFILLMKNMPMENKPGFIIQVLLLLACGVAANIAGYYILTGVGSNLLDPRLYLLIGAASIPLGIAFFKFLKFWKFTRQAEEEEDDTQD